MDTCLGWGWTLGFVILSEHTWELALSTILHTTLRTLLWMLWARIEILITAAELNRYRLNTVGSGR